MNKLILTFAMTTIAVVSVSANAGPDVGQMMDREKANKAAAEHRALETPKTANTVPRIALPLDHGPHAQTTPWVNKQRLLRAEALAADAAKGGAVDK